MQQTTHHSRPDNPTSPLPPRQQCSLTTAAASPNTTPALQKLLRKGSRKTTKSPRHWPCLQTLQVPNQQHHRAMRWKSPIYGSLLVIPSATAWYHQCKEGLKSVFTLACTVSSSFMLTFEISVPTVICSMIQSIALCCMWLGNAWKWAVLNMIQVVNPSESRLP